MKARLDSCDPDRLRLLAEDLLSPAELVRLERHLEACAGCRQTLDDLVEQDGCLSAARRHLSDDLTGPYAAIGHAPESLDFLAPSDWPDSLGRLGNYEVKGVIGRGGMGVVLKAFDPALASERRDQGALRRAGHLRGRAAAVSPRSAGGGGGRPRARRRVSSPSSRRLGCRSWSWNTSPAASLQERLDRDGPLALPEILRIGMQTAAGLAAAHAQGLVHRDVKPANILLENGVERVRLTDFGLARAAADAAMTQSGMVAGTPHYMAPEQARGETADHRADLFSLGSTLYAMCTGAPAVPGRVAAGRAPPRLRRRATADPRAQPGRPRTGWRRSSPRLHGQGPGPSGS